MPGSGRLLAPRHPEQPPDLGVANDLGRDQDRPDATGRQTPEIIPGSDFDLEADLVIKALGFDPEDMPGMFGETALGLTRWGTLKTDFRTLMTDRKSVV